MWPIRGSIEPGQHDNADEDKGGRSSDHPKLRCAVVGQAAAVKFGDASNRCAPAVGARPPVRCAKDCG